MARRQAAVVHSISALGVGLLIGGVLGYAFMGTAHTVSAQVHCLKCLLATGLWPACLAGSRPAYQVSPQRAGCPACDKTGATLQRCSGTWLPFPCVIHNALVPLSSALGALANLLPRPGCWGGLPDCLLATPQGGQGSACTNPPPGTPSGPCTQVLQMGAGPQRVAGDLSTMATPDRQLHMMGGEWEVFQPRALSTKAAQQANVLQPSKAAEQATSVAGGQGLSLLQTAIVAELPWPRTGRTIHTVCTSNGSPYLNFQTRIM